MKLGHDIVIATRNRPDALILSVDSILSGQQRSPENLIIVDSSDENFKIVESIEKIRSKYNREIIFIKSPRANSSFQRNIGLEKADSDITIFPDDDSIFYPGAIDEIVRIYEKDNECLIAGVCAAEALVPPPTFPIQKAYRQNTTERIKKKFGYFRYKLEHVFIPDPFYLIGKNFIEKSKKISWLTDENAVKVEYMTGFRMSFRSNIIKKIRFNELFDSYCLFEDIDASFSAYNEGILVGARNARIYHHKFPSKRSNGFNLGLWQILNRAYISLKHSDECSTNKLRIFTYYKMIQYLLTAYSQHGLERYRGARLATLNLKKLIKSKKNNQLDSEYLKIVKS